MILGIDTSNSPLAIALVKDDTVLIEETQNLKINHSLTAMPAIEELMKKAKIAPGDLTQIVVAEGPGSYTGVRIGLTIAKTLAWSLKIPLVSVSSLKVLAANGQDFDGLVCPVMDARRGTVFTALYDGQHLKTVISDQHSDFKTFLKQVRMQERPVLFTGVDLEIHRSLIEETLGELAHFAPFPNRLPRASKLIALAGGENVKEVHHTVPEYRRITEAEANLTKTEKGKNQ
ncbi:tRNA (adenosine(37)-N6)-threonylcarbamoyltransferase complex dimerization subunit type 1 TsaB [Planococcus sp. CP5-4]|uniref:tRNA (adenosine(37)-N6)-threonylcarbamoyltransferase complex dimerization subunit type 1 TsaB n=1 Tax=unclassified Planococcus (in: firmicutes) TaxID=2662419 RepID=UPI001C21CC1D|nr:MULTISPECIES: tRNA (adenosine(37)-N6)-threonylcarbamoyltransferase complex dimerization subunit type 1 TsaB [unclassified Planococcus (in: firmicutes)]MBU9674101.1 tRNA (adenosine(37)-N6)-threonylcarbamoyltransferase complex dimerization subunit type 1 TsaB [Planococcus sp. CP5-4_YE]MBV0909972.1 tRNA (adenosine(37)-N6)-threonylcarbamoyltransferase complex dimerization subunit type 1 TsaB [Planococcus sp. CP5-4_UN]MBW6064852.1 tRNA (adenosine(37)-N6)-threonylcarbamoyltransferase complex dimeri